MTRADEDADTGVKTGPRSFAADPEVLSRHFGAHDPLPLWVAEPYFDLAAPILDALSTRADLGWYGYESRPGEVIASFWDWMDARHRWTGEGLTTSVSPSIGTSIGVLIDLLTEPGDGIILQPPVFTDFKPLITSAGRRVVKNPIVLSDEGYRMDLDDLDARAADPTTRLMILCNPHNPVGRVWARTELADVAAICAHHDVTVLADEIHCDLMLGQSSFVPFATAASGSDVRWAATHGPIKTFGLAGLCDTLLVTDDTDITEGFRSVSSRHHLTRNNVFGVAAFEAGYRYGGPWLDGFLDEVARNVGVLRAGLGDTVALVEPEGTYLAWLDFRNVGVDVGELPRWLGREVGVAMSPGHWFGREGAGFARMSIGVPTPVVEEAVDRIRRAVRG